MSTLETNLIQPSTGTSLTIGASGDTITIPSGATITNSGTATGFGANTPAFEAYISSAPSISQATLTILAYNAENFDTASAYDTSTYKFTPQTSGKYFVYAKARINDAGDSDNNQLQIFKNTSKVAETLWRAEYFESPFLAATITLNGSSDYVQVKIYHNFAGTKTVDTDGSVFGAYKIIE